MVGEQPFAVLIVGPTAVGKSSLALALAEEHDGEIVSLDSRQMVRGLDIGTAKPTAHEQQRARHHLIDITTPDVPLALPDVLKLIEAAVTDVSSRGRLPVLVGGTGQYVRALREGWQVPSVDPDPALREALATYADSAGATALHARLARLDAAAAARIDPRNVRRVIRAIEVATARAVDNSDRTAPRANEPWLDLLIVGLTRPRPELYARVDERIDAMLTAGLETEVRHLVACGYDWHLPAMSSVGYGEWRGYFEGRVDALEVIRLIRHNTRRLVRNQSAWFAAEDPGIRWLQLVEQRLEPSGTCDPTNQSAALRQVAEWLAARSAGSNVTPEEPPRTAGQYNAAHD